MLCTDSDLPEEYLIQVWGATNEFAILFSAVEDDYGLISLNALKLYKVGNQGGLFLPPVLLPDEFSKLQQLKVWLKHEGDSLQGEWHAGNEDAGLLAFSTKSQSRELVATKCLTWAAFKEWTVEARDKHEVMAFRGHGSSDFNLRTTLQRAGRNRLERYEVEVLQEFRSHAEAVLNTRFDLQNGDDYSVLLGLAQHHGLPTPLLDWTDSPYIASFFAFSDAFENMALRHEATHVRIYGLTRSFLASHWTPRVTLPYKCPYVSPLKITPRLNPRMYAQQGQFLVTNIADVEQYIAQHDTNRGTVSLIAADIPITCCAEALRDLNFMGLNAANLFPGLDGVGRMLKHAMAFSGFRPSPMPEPQKTEQLAN